MNKWQDMFSVMPVTQQVGHPDILSTMMSTHYRLVYKPTNQYHNETHYFTETLAEEAAKSLFRSYMEIIEKELLGTSN